MKKTEITQIIELAFVFVVTLAMVIYGGAKYLQFGNGTLPAKTVAEMTGMELMWSFYGYSKTYPILIGIAEITGGILLLFRKTRILGGVLLTGILSNVILQDIIYEVNRGALAAAIIYQFMIFGILWINRISFIAGIKALFLKKNSTELTTKRKVIVIGAAIFLAVVLKFLEMKITHWS